MNPEDYTLTRYLLAHGPSTASELPGTNTLKPWHREAGATRFSPLKANSRAVYYIEGKHDPERVLRTWISKNGNVLETRTPRQLLGIINDAGSQFKAISKEVVKEKYSDDEYQQSFGGNNSGGDQSGESNAYRIAADADPDVI